MTSLFPAASNPATLPSVSVITLTTDFGTRDWFVGTMKGVIAVIAPEACVIDLTHEISPGDVWGGCVAKKSEEAVFTIFLTFNI